MFEVRKAKRSRRPLKINLEGLSGSGKTFTLIRLAMAMMRAGIGKRFVIADSENESAGLYAGIEIDGQKWEYETCSIPPDMQNPRGYTEAYKYLVSQGYDIIGMDSMTHAWHGAMEQVDAIARRSNRGDKFAAWAEVTPAHREMLSTITDSRAHLISTMRVKSEYERYEKPNGKDGIRKVGTKTDQREGAEYEFDVVARLDGGHECFIEKVRGCTAMDGKSCVKPGPEFWKPLFDWWLSAEEVKQLPAPTVNTGEPSDRGDIEEECFRLIDTIAAMKELAWRDAYWKALNFLKLNYPDLADIPYGQLGVLRNSLKETVEKINAREANGKPATVA